MLVHHASWSRKTSARKTKTKGQDRVEGDKIIPWLNKRIVDFLVDMKVDNLLISSIQQSIHLHEVQDRNFQQSSQ